ncbi:thioredoxin family protein [Vampirovibrio sp.]|uniref:thioredoxin family protein n=1 Tax=Vampirovibrio sp. TaxID=2717857 RepID=UPI0035933500
MMNGFLIGLIVLVMGLGGVAIFRSLDVQNRVSASFQGWYEDAPGYQRAMSDQSATQKPVLLYFYATWCPHCKQFAANVLSDPKTQTFIKAFPHVRIAPDNGEAEKKLMSEFGAEGYPAFYVVRPNQQPIQIDTFASTPTPHPKTATEFIDSIQAVLNQ